VEAELIWYRYEFRLF